MYVLILGFLGIKLAKDQETCRWAQEYFQHHDDRDKLEKLLEEKGMSPVAYLADLGVLSDRTVAAHCVHVSPGDIEILEEARVVPGQP